VFTAESVVLSGTHWEIRYTVRNVGVVATPAFHVSVQQDPSTLISNKVYASLAPGGSRSEVLGIEATSCYVAVRFTADSTHAVNELREDDNVREAVGLSSPACSAQPRYTVKAVSFHAVDESGIDRLGSDEVYGVFSSVGTNPVTASTSTSHRFEDIDTGDTAAFDPMDGCIYRTCSLGGTAPIGLSIQLWEHDFGDVPAIVEHIATGFKTAGAILIFTAMPVWVSATAALIGFTLDQVIKWAGDDLIGTQTLALAPTFLALKLPAIGGTFTNTERYSGASTSGGAVYDLTFAITRVA
jgi:hypothetical protein